MSEKLTATGIDVNTLVHVSTAMGAIKQNPSKDEMSQAALRSVARSKMSPAKRLIERQRLKRSAGK